ncbi:MAG: RNA polymerase sigma factor [Bradymonadia bacterium]
MLIIALLSLCLSVALKANAQDQDKRLITEALSGDRTSMQQIIRRLLPVIQSRVRVYLSRRSGQRLGGQDADDLIQEIWLALIKDEGRVLMAYDPDRGMSLEGYTGLICRRELWRRAESSQSERRGGHLKLVELDEARDTQSQENPEQLTVARGDLKRLYTYLMTELPPRGQLVLMALYEDGLSAEQAAEFVGVTKQVIYNWQHKIRKLSRAFLAPT